jgi:hypothetical protein
VVAAADPGNAPLEAHHEAMCNAAMDASGLLEGLPPAKGAQIRSLVHYCISATGAHPPYDHTADLCLVPKGAIGALGARLVLAGAGYTGASAGRVPRNADSLGQLIG